MVAPANNSANVVADALTLYDFGPKRAADDDEMEEEEEAPTHINTKRSLQFLVVSVDKLSAKYTGDGKHANDVGAIQGNRPAPVRRLLYYFEIYIKDRGNRGTISIGFTDEHFKTTRQPGWDPNTYGYHGDDGYLYYRGNGHGEPFGSTFQTGDTVGAGINYSSQEIFFTLNGKLVGSRHKDVKCPLYPSVGMHSPNERVDINFGQNPFVFNIEALVHEEREKLRMEIEALHLPLSISHSVVRSYLLHYAYQETLHAFDATSGSMVPAVLLNNQVNGDKMIEEESYAFEHRKKLRQLIRNGDINGAIAQLEIWYPQLLQDETLRIKFLLDCQQFIELIKVGSLEAAVKHAQEKLANLMGVGLYQTLLQDCIALLAYEHPKESPVGHLLMLGQREAVADAINSAILITDPSLPSSRSSPQSTLEKLLRQLTACHTEKWKLNGGQGEMFRLHRVLRGKEGPW
ncbi:hypothetical protein KP509_1Z067400 [Ceratopteris richardii]|nr:hypothetical protein KP509_1Z067400 [Ceratopteris richardii]